MKKTLFTASILTLGLALSGVAQASSENAPTPIAAQESAAPTADAATVDADPALWVVKDEDTTIYLFGTVHVLKPGLSWFDEAVKDAFDASDELVLEVIQPSDTQAQQIVFSLAIDPANPLRSRLNEEQLATYDGAMTKLGLPTNAFDQFEPWFASVNMGLLPLIKAGYDPTSGAETVLTNAAKASGKEISALEGFEEQLGFFDTLPIDSQITLLLGSAEGIDETTGFVDKMVAQWGDGNTDKLAALLNEGFGDPITYETLLTKRNTNWVEWIDTRLDTPGTVFIAVGAGHLAGDDSVQEQLKTKIIAATRIDY